MEQHRGSAEACSRYGNAKPTEVDREAASLPVPRFVTAKVVAKVFDITTAQVYTLTREGILPACRLGRAIRYDVRELEEFASSGGRRFEHGWRREAPE